MSDVGVEPALSVGGAWRGVWLPLVVLVLPSLAAAFPEPPPEVDPGADYATEARDSVPDGALELAWLARGQSGRSGFSRHNRIC